MKKEQTCDVKLSLNGDFLYFHIQFSPVRYHEKVVGEIITFIDVTERVSLQEKLEKLASIDGLTQVFNRTYFFQETEQVFENLQKQGGKVSFVLFDIDYFKKVNDQYGHKAGDIVLTHLIKVTKSCLREQDIIGRYGGEEFVICMPNTSEVEAFEVANKIRLNIIKSPVFLDHKEIHVTSSFGISSTTLDVKDDLHSMHVLVNEADQALYEAKNRGRNCVQVYQRNEIPV